MYFLFSLSGLFLKPTHWHPVSVHESNEESAVRRTLLPSLCHEIDLYSFGKISNEPAAEIVEIKNDDCRTKDGRMRKPEVKWKGIQ